MNDPIRDQLWANVYAALLAKGKIWFECENEANTAVKAYDRRERPKQEQTQ